MDIRLEITNDGLTDDYVKKIYYAHANLFAEMPNNVLGLNVPCTIRISPSLIMINKGKVIKYKEIKVCLETDRGIVVALKKGGYFFLPVGKTEDYNINLVSIKGTLNDFFRKLFYYKYIVLKELDFSVEKKEPLYKINGKELAVIKGHVTKRELKKEAIIRYFIDLSNYMNILMIAFSILGIYAVGVGPGFHPLVFWACEIAAVGIGLTGLYLEFSAVVGIIKTYFRKRKQMEEETWILLNEEFIIQNEESQNIIRFRYKWFNKCFRLFDTLILGMDLLGNFIMVPVRMVKEDSRFLPIMKEKIKGK